MSGPDRDSSPGRRAVEVAQTTLIRNRWSLGARGGHPPKQGYENVAQFEDGFEARRLQVYPVAPHARPQMPSCGGRVAGCRESATPPGLQLLPCCSLAMPKPEDAEGDRSDG